jgi:hypothetical protein
MNQKRVVSIMAGLVFAVTTFLGAAAHAADKASENPIYDESAYTEYVQNTMKELNKLYLDFCGTCSVDAAKAEKARKEFLTRVRELMGRMNTRFDSLDPKKGAALSPTETLVSIHVLTMLVDILTATQLEQMAEHPYN